MMRGGLSNSVLPVIAALKFLSPAVLRSRTALLVLRSNTVENGFWQGSIENEIQTKSWICHRLVG
jgi:hypothetical protein